MKLTEQQLAQLFKQSKSQNDNSEVDSLLDSLDASEKRLNDVEKIANNSQLSASYQVINQLKNWSSEMSKDINQKLNKSNFASAILNWIKPTLATAAIVSAVYFTVPNINPSVNSLQSKPDQTMFTGSFEKGNQQVLPTKSIPKTDSDVIYKGNFG